MKAAFYAVVWEILWKNRLVLVALLVLLGLGGVLAVTAAHADPDAAWIPRARNVTILAFLISMFLGVAPFSLMETQSGWRMNTMITRWFAMPARTTWLVLAPLLAAGMFIPLLVTGWMPVLDRIAPGLDYLHFTAVMLAGIVAVHAIAWTVPRKASQFWIGAAILLPIVMVLALGPQDLEAHQRRGMLIPLSYVSVALVAFAWYAARRNRCGDWPGELPLDRLWGYLRQGGATSVKQTDFRSSSTALFWSDSLPPFRLMAFGWMSLGLVLFVYFSLVMQHERPELAFSLRLLAFIVVDLIAVIGIVWLAVWGIFAGCEPSTGFRTRLSSYRATLPITSGAIAGQKILVLLLGWCVVWIPPLVLSTWYDPQVNGTTSPEAVAQLRLILARFMAISGSLVVGVLPLFLWGRLTGFPNLLLSAICYWGALWSLMSQLTPEGQPGNLWVLLLVLLAAKFLAAGGGIVLSLRYGHITWKFAVLLVIGWSAMAAWVAWVLGTWRTDGAYAGLLLVFLMPLARLAWSPFAVACNRQR
jgi:hypothetical protein